MSGEQSAVNMSNPFLKDIGEYQMVAKNQESGVEVKSRKISLNMEEIKKAPKEDPKEVEAAAAADALVKTEEVSTAPKKKKKKARIKPLHTRISEL